MYAEFYGLKEPPFNITPDPRFLYLNDCCQEAVAALTYGIEARKGFISLIGEAGTGKTTLLRHVLDTLGPGTRTVLLLTPTVSFDEILEHILVELGIPTEGGGKLVRLQRLNEFLIEHTRAGGNVALLIDEAQDMSPAVLEELRLLSNLETAREKILQIILAGQPELEATLANPSLRQLRQRVTLRVRLRPLTTAEVTPYVRNRLERAGAARPDVFVPAALARVAVLTEGVPRLVNVLCDAALLAAFAAGRRRVTRGIVEEAWRDYASDVLQVPRPAAARPAPEPEPARAPTDEPCPAAPGVPTRVEAAPEVEDEADVEPERGTDPEADGLPEEAEAAARASAADVPAPPRGTLSVPMAAGVVIAMALLLYTTSRREDVLDDRPSASDGAVAVAPVPARPAAQPTEPAAPSPAPVAAAGPSAAVAAVRPAGAGAPERPLSAFEATALVDEFRAAYEARDVERLVALFAEDAIENGREGREAIAAAYRSTLPALAQVGYGIARLAVEPRGARAQVRAPFVLRYTPQGGEVRELHGEAEWAVERREGRPQIVVLNYRLDPIEPAR